MKGLKHSLLVLALAGAFALSASRSVAQQYTVSDLGKAVTSSEAHSLNDQGEAVGAVGGSHGGDLVAYIWPANGARAIGRPQHSDFSEAFGVNNSGLVVGAANLETGVRGFLWGTQGANLILLPPLAGDSSSEAFAINDNGLIAGFSSGPKGQSAVLWQNQVPQAIVPTSVSASSQAMAIDSQGDVVGTVGSGDNARAFLWNAASGLKTLAPLSNDSASEAFAVNASGTVVGDSQEPGGVTHATLWDPAGAHELGTLTGGTHSQAYGINGAGIVVGSSGSALGLRAFIWDSANGMRDLNSLIPSSAPLVLNAAVAVNDSGQILAIGVPAADQNHMLQLDRDNHSGVTRVYLLTPQTTAASAHSATTPAASPAVPATKPR